MTIRSRVVTALMLCLPIHLVMGCGDKTPSIEEMTWRRNKDITHEYVSDIHVLIDGQSIDSGSLTIPQGKRIEITGTLRYKPDMAFDPNQLMGDVTIAHRPEGTDETSWAVSDLDREWFGPNEPTFEFSGQVNLVPGKYELRVYVTTTPMEDNLPRVEHVARGQMTVVVASDLPAKDRQNSK